MSVSRRHSLNEPGTSDPVGVPSVRERAMRIIAKQFPYFLASGDICDETSLEDFGADPLDLVEMLHAFEDEFHIELPDEMLDEMATVGQCIAALERRLNTEG